MYFFIVLNLSLLIIILFSSCFPKLTDDAGYILNDASVRLIHNLEKDTLIKSSYEETYNLPGTKFPLLTSINKIDTTHPMGIQIKLWGYIITEKHSRFYGRYPRKGLIGKINSITINLKTEKKRLNHSDSS